MEYAPVPLRRRMPQLNRCEPLIPDHTSMDVFKECPTRYFFKIVLGFKAQSSQIYFNWGSAYHKFREVLEVEYRNSGEMDSAFTKASNAGIRLWKEKQGRDPEVGTRFEFMTGARLLKSFGVAYQHWKREKERGEIEVIATEQIFNVALEDGSRTSGRADQIIRVRGKLWGRDFKTSSQDGEFFERTLEPNDQFTRYTFAEGVLHGEPVQGQYVEVLFNKKDHKTSRGQSDCGPSIRTYLAARTWDQVKQWERDTIMWNTFIETCRAVDVWPMNETACRFCEFHQVCKLPDEGAQIYTLQGKDYVKEEWDNSLV